MKMENKKHYWPDEVRLKMIEKSEFYSEPKIYQFGFYDGYHSLTRELSELREENKKLTEIEDCNRRTWLNERQAYAEIREENERLKEGLKAMLNEFTPTNYDLFCDHSVGLCACKPLDIIDNATQLLQSKKP
jgi:hypothetical protein